MKENHRIINFLVTSNQIIQQGGQICYIIHLEVMRSLKVLWRSLIELCTQINPFPHCLYFTFQPPSTKPTCHVPASWTMSYSLQMKTYSLEYTSTCSLWCSIWYIIWFHHLTGLYRDGRLFFSNSYLLILIPWWLIGAPLLISVDAFQFLYSSLTEYLWLVE